MTKAKSATAQGAANNFITPVKSIKGLTTPPTPKAVNAFREAVVDAERARKGTY
jgi:hypothetical protein